MEETLEKLLEDLEVSLSERKIDVMKDSLEILKNDDKFDLYVDKLSEGLDDSQKQEFATWAQNSRQEFLEESATSADFNAFAPMQITLLRSILPRLVMRNLITHKTLATPAEQFGYLKAYIKDSMGNVTELSELRSKTQFKQTEINKNNIALPAVAVDLFAGITVAPLTLDRKFYFTNIVVTCKNASDASPEDVTVTDTFTQGVDGGNIAYVVKAAHSDGTITSAKIFGSIDRITGELNLLSTSPAVKSVSFRGKTSPEYNNTSTWTIQHKYTKDTIEVGEGDVINSPLPYSYIKDLGALFKLDAMGQAIKTIGQAYSTIDDIRIMEDLYDAVDGDLERTLTWNAQKPDGITKLEHNLELVERVNKAIAITDDRTQFSGSVRFNILANPIDASIMSSTRITPNSFTGSISKGGSLNNFNQFDITSGNGDVGVYSTKLAKRGEILIIPISSVDEEVVYAKYEYSNILFSNNELRSADAPLVKNIASIQRNAYKKFRTDAISKIIVQNNTL